MQYTDLIAHIIDGAWIIFMLIWLVSAFSAKQTARSSPGTWFAYRLGTIVVIYLLLRFTGSAGRVVLTYFHSPAIRWTGVVLTYLGVALAVWARYHLGRNWGMPMSEKQGAELITTGPYAYIRNPIYSGVLLAALGSTLALGLLWGIFLIISGAYFIWSVFGEEKIMARLFPDTYPAYKARTKRLIPGIF